MKNLTCPECKNNVDLSGQENISKEQVLECNHCGMTLMVTNPEGEEIQTEIVDEGK